MRLLNGIEKNTLGIKMYDLDLKNRRTLIDSIGKLDGFNTGAEVGVRLGWYTKYILDNTDMKIYAVDPWEINAELLQRSEETYDHCEKITSDYGERCEMVKGYSPNIAENFEDESLDFVYIDALHDYESVLDDIKGWFPKVREGGIIAGHDYRMSSWPGVVIAVQEFAEEEGLEILETGTLGNARESMTGDIDEYDGDEPSWIIIKEE